MNIESKSVCEYLDLSPLGCIPVRLYFQSGNLVKITLGTRYQEDLENYPNGVYAHFLRGLLSGMALEKFTVPFKLIGSPFQRRIWRITMTIRHGQTMTYGEIAEIANCASPQAVGQALKRNPLPIIVPCHRVIGKGGQLTGFSAGIEIKKFLLQFERIASYENSHNERQPRQPLELENSS